METGWGLLVFIPTFVYSGRGNGANLTFSSDVTLPHGCCCIVNVNRTWWHPRHPPTPRSKTKNAEGREGKGWGALPKFPSDMISMRLFWQTNVILNTFSNGIFHSLSLGGGAVILPPIWKPAQAIPTSNASCTNAHAVWYRHSGLSTVIFRRRSDHVCVCRACGLGGRAQTNKELYFSCKKHICLCL